MKRILLLTFFLILIQEFTAMDYKPVPMEITLEPVRINNTDALTAIRLQETSDRKQPVLFYSLKGQKESDPALTLYALTLEKKAQPELVKTIAEAGFIPEWDILPKDKKNYSLIYNDARGFSCPLILDALKIGETGFFTEKLPYGSFSNPRFIRNSNPGSFIISTICDIKKLMVFKSDKSYKEVCKANLARILPRKEGYMVFIKRNIDGAAKNNIPRGLLTAFRTDKEFGKPEKTLLPFEDMNILEFSVAAADNLFILFATTIQGYVIYGFTLDKAGKTLFHEEIPWEKSLSEPEILILKKTAVIAIMESPQAPGTRVLSAKWDITRFME